MAKNHITFYVDIISPFAYMAHWMLENHPTFKSCEVTYVPILLGGVMKSTGNTAPRDIQNKDKWIEIERLRWASQFGIPMRDLPPPSFRTPTINTARVLASLERQSPAHLPIAVATLYTALWAPDYLPHPPRSAGSDYDVNDVKTLMELLSPEVVLGPDLTRSIVSTVTAAETKQHLRLNTDQAIENGAFGLPWLRCTNATGEVESFWGFDHLGQVARFLGLVQDQTTLVAGTLRWML